MQCLLFRINLVELNKGGYEATCLARLQPISIEHSSPNSALVTQNHKILRSSAVGQIKSTPQLKHLIISANGVKVRLQIFVTLLLVSSKEHKSKTDYSHILKLIISIDTQVLHNLHNTEV